MVLELSYYAFPERDFEEEVPPMSCYLSLRTSPKPSKSLDEDGVA